MEKTQQALFIMNSWALSKSSAAYVAVKIKIKIKIKDF